MKTYKIALIKGDGIGPEIIDEATKVMDSVASCFDFVRIDRLISRFLIIFCNWTGTAIRK